MCLRFIGRFRNLAKLLRGSANPMDLFERYAHPTATPSDTTLEHILLDFDVGAFAREVDGILYPLEIEDISRAVDDGHFNVDVGGETLAVSVCWDPRRRRYELDGKDLRSFRFIEQAGDRREFVSAINEDQAFRAIPTGREAIYARGHFYKPILPARRAGAFKLLDALTPVTQLVGLGEEKGEIANDDWTEKSVFGLISALDPGTSREPPREFEDLLGDPDLLICTDKGQEIADFIAVKGKRVVFIHAKASTDTRKYSASALHVITAQAIKNLPYLQPLTELRPPTNYWSNPWKPDAGDSPSTRRLRVGAKESGAKVWDRIRSCVSDPQTEREVWIVLGNCLSKDALRTEARPKGAAEAIQTYALLQTAWGAISQVGAKMRVFCSP